MPDRQDEDSSGFLTKGYYLDYWNTYVKSEALHFEGWDKLCSRIKEVVGVEFEVLFIIGNALHTREWGTRMCYYLPDMKGGE